VPASNRNFAWGYRDLFCFTYSFTCQGTSTRRQRSDLFDRVWVLFWVGVGVLHKKF